MREHALAAARSSTRPTYRQPIEHHNPMETHATTVVWRRRPADRLRHDPGRRRTCASTSPRRSASKPSNVRVINPYVGGGFGSRAAAVVRTSCWPRWPRTSCRALGRVVLDAPADVQLVGHRPEDDQTIALGADARRHAARRSRHDVDRRRPRATRTTPRSVVQLAVALLLRVRRTCSVAHARARSTSRRPTFMRAPGEATGMFALESAMDELAYALGIDPLELRLRNHADPRRARGQAVLEQVAARVLRAGAPSGSAGRGARRRRARCATATS